MFRPARLVTPVRILGLFCIGFLIGRFLPSYYAKTRWTLRMKKLCNNIPTASIPIVSATEADNPQDALVIGVITARKNLATRATGIYSTWGKNVPGQIVFYIGKNESALINSTLNLQSKTKFEPVRIVQGLPVVELDVYDNFYPPRNKTFAMLHHMYHSFKGRYRWFMRADDDVYVRPEQLVKLLKSVQTYIPRYIGRASYGQTSERNRLGLKLKYCTGGPGMIFSLQTLEAMVPHLDQCASNPFTFHEDTEVGRCVEKFVNVSCAYDRKRSIESFRHMYSFSNLPELRMRISMAISLHPAKSITSMKKLHFMSKLQDLQDIRDGRDMLFHQLRKVNAALSEGRNRSAFTMGEMLHSHRHYRVEDFVTQTRNSDPRRPFIPVAKGESDVSEVLTEQTPAWDSWIGKRKYVSNSARTVSALDYKMVYDSRILLKYFLETHHLTALSVKNTGTVYQTHTLTHGLQHFITLTNKKRHQYRSFIVSSEFQHLQWQDIGGGRMQPKEGYSQDKTNSSDAKKTLSPTIQSSRFDLHILLPLFNRYRDYQAFLGNLTAASNTYPGSIHLRVTLYADPNAKDNFSSIADQTNSSLTVRVKRTNSSGWKSVKLTTLAGRLSDSAVVVLMDVGMVFNAYFLNRVANNVVPGTAYFPVPFAQYSLETVCYNDTDNCTLSSLFDVSMDSGTWFEDGFTAVGITVADLKKVNCYNKDVRAWGGSEADFSAK